MEPEKSLGQHWLTDKYSLASIAEQAEIQAGETVLEIGPGQGHLTKTLLSAGARVIAVEIDTRLIAEISTRFQNTPAETLSIINEDFLKFNLAGLPASYKVVANIPYFLTGKIVRLFIDSEFKPSTIVLLVQKEVARRLAAKPGDLSIMAILSQHFYEVSLGPVILARLFTPPPKVDSQVIKMVLKAEPEAVNFVEFSHLVRVGFSSKRKKLANNLKAGLKLTPGRVDELIAKVGLDTNCRAQELTLEQWYLLLAEYDKLSHENT